MTRPLRFALLLLLSIAMIPTFARAEPCTLYKAADVANARKNVATHAWAKRIVEGWKTARSVDHGEGSRVHRNNDPRAYPLADVRPKLPGLRGREIVDG